MTEKQKRTAGPWRVSNTGGGRPTIVYDAGGFAICDCKTYHGRNEQDTGNAHLIAAAPDLLASLNDALYLLRHNYMHMQRRAYGPQSREQVFEAFERLPYVKKARAAIAKAEGGEE